MSAVIAILILALLGLVILVVAAPLRAARRVAASAGEGAPSADGGARVTPGARIEADELDAAREAKYREIRDAEMDFRTGKLSATDYQTIDSQLRAEALEILDRLEHEPAQNTGRGGERLNGDDTRG